VPIKSTWWRAACSEASMALDWGVWGVAQEQEVAQDWKVA